MRKTAFVYDSILSKHVLRNTHPMKPVRLQYTYDLLNSYGIFEESSVKLIGPREAIYEELASIHSREYISAVRSLSAGLKEYLPEKYGFSASGDNPIFTDMYQAAALSTGASLIGAELVNSGESDVAFSISGGLHHADRNSASGFCIFNDPAIAIKYFVNNGKRVAYVDIDAHHGDGVQNAFYDDNRVLTISLHESGSYLFPGTGFSNEIGNEHGKGYSVNLPLYPYTTDELYVWVFKQVAIPMINAFQPDVLVAQLGVDSYYTDPLTHLNITSTGYAEVVQNIMDTNIPCLALGGGGYDVMAVARCWSLAYSVMSDIDLSDTIPSDFASKYGVHILRDSVKMDIPEEILEESSKLAEESVAYIKKHCFPVHRIE
ncbi:MAG: acetoin utilization protein AcuC [Chloroflexota bacterium]|nr:acetoin utilization protein AcuC [Chloroflexota bacterium]